MDSTTDAFLLDSIADEAAAAFNSGVHCIQPFTSRHPGLTMEQAYRITARANARRIAHGFTPLGRKIGFTNRRLWDEYGVGAPIWGYVYDRTVFELRNPATGGETTVLPLAPYSAPKIEPEIIFGLGKAPSPGMNDASILSCIAWIALGYEIVQSIYPDWAFAAPDTVIADALHGALLIGPRHDIGARANEWLRSLASFNVSISCNDKLMDTGHALSVLDGPLSTIRYVMELLARDRDNRPLAAGEIISTGTLTRALPVKPGETWTTSVSGIALDSATITFD